jgi:hypothetical protein
VLVAINFEVFMSIFSSICAEHHLEIVKRAIAKAVAQAQTEEAKALLNQVQQECEAQITE